MPPDLHVYVTCMSMHTHIHTHNQEYNFRCIYFMCMFCQCVCMCILCVQCTSLRRPNSPCGRAAESCLSLPQKWSPRVSTAQGLPNHICQTPLQLGVARTRLSCEPMKFRRAPCLSFALGFRQPWPLICGAQTPPSGSSCFLLFLASM